LLDIWLLGYCKDCHTVNVQFDLYNFGYGRSNTVDLTAFESVPGTNQY